MKVLEINALTKKYGALKAINNLSLSIEAGQVFGFLGPNGSGKTTTLGIVLGILNSDSGDYQWFEGQKGQGQKPLRHVGTLLETPNFFPFMTAEQNLAVVAHIKKAERVNYHDLLTLVNLAHRKDTPFRAYSLGMKQRLAIAATLIGDPDVLIFDEPTNGLDPTGIAEVRHTIQQIAERGKTIFMASHILDEVERVCTDVAIIKKGDLLAVGPIGGILGNTLTVEIQAENADILRGYLQEAPFVSQIKSHKNVFVVEVPGDISALDIGRWAYGKGLILTHLVVRKQRLEEEFLKVTA